jgi:hypothetical protein
MPPPYVVTTPENERIRASSPNLERCLIAPESFNPEAVTPPEFHVMVAG